MSNNLCQGLLNPPVANLNIVGTMLCAGGDGLKDACMGDSGGALFLPAGEGRPLPVAIGIVSWGVGCGLPDTPGVYTRVSAYTDWLQAQALANREDNSSPQRNTLTRPLHDCRRE